MFRMESVELIRYSAFCALVAVSSAWSIPGSSRFMVRKGGPGGALCRAGLGLRQGARLSTNLVAQYGGGPPMDKEPLDATEENVAQAIEEAKKVGIFLHTAYF